MTTTIHKFAVGQTISAKASGKLYLVLRLRSDFHDNRKLKGEIGYDVVGLRDGKRYGPVRLMRESAFNPPVPRDTWADPQAAF